MFSKEKHRTMLVKILKDIYSDPVLRVSLGFKGGTAAFLFYSLPRLSVDLDFDLLKPGVEEEVLIRMKKILEKHGKLKDVSVKKNTLFFLISYDSKDRNIKIEISRRKTLSSFEKKDFLGMPVLVMKKEDIFANKIAAFLTRKKFAARDLFDIWFFLKNDWEISEKILKARLGIPVDQALKKTLEKVEKIKPRQLLQGLGELLEEKDKKWVKEELLKEIKFLLRLRI